MVPESHSERIRLRHLARFPHSRSLQRLHGFRLVEMQHGIELLGQTRPESSGLLDSTRVPSATVYCARSSRKLRRNGRLGHVLVTPNGYRLLTGALPRDPEAVEAMMRRP